MSLQLVKEIDIDIQKCIICQKVKDRNGEKKLTSTENGREMIRNSSEILKDNLLHSLNTECLSKIKYHVHTCYSRYVRQATKRSNAKEATGNEENNNFEDVKAENDNTRSESRPKRRKTVDTPQTCVICNFVKCKGYTKLSRISESKRAKRFLAATRFFKDDTYRRTILLETPGDVFAADIMYHKNCLNQYFLHFKREIEEILSYEEETEESVDVIFSDIVTCIDLDKKAHVLSDLRDLVNQRIKEAELDCELSNRSVKDMLIKHFGDTICFSYPMNKSKSQMFFSSNIVATDVVETLRSNDPVKMCAQLLRDECQEYNFDLEKTYKSAEDLILSSETFLKKKPRVWEKFCNTFMPQKNKFENQKRKCDVIFQILFNLVHNGTKKTPIHVGLAEAIHDACKSKTLIQVLNRLGLCMSYDEMERIDNALAKRIVDASGDDNVPVSSSIQPEEIIHGAMDNFDHDENTASGIGGSHDTVLVLFQNSKSNEESEIMSITPQEKHLQRSFSHTLSCQSLKKSGTFGKRGTIAADFKPSKESIDKKHAESSNSDFIIWSASRSTLMTTNSCSIPSFIAMKSLLLDPVTNLTRYAFTPIIPHPATEQDTIYTCMKNYQNVLLQKQLDYGPLWCDEGVYRIAKELQLLKPDEFQNIFLGLGGFHMEKVLIGCCGQYLEDIGVDAIFTEQETFGPGVVKSVMSGGNYIRGKRGMNLLSEAIQHLMFSEFLSQNGSKFENHFPVFCDMLHNLQKCIPDANEDKISNEWQKCMEESSEFKKALKEFILEGSSKSKQFNYWSNFLQNIVSVLRDLTSSFREANWYLHLSAVRRAIPLLFAFDRVNYKRWVPLYLEDCLALPQRFPKLHEAFCSGDFVVIQSHRKASGIPVDQALEKQYNKVAKSQSGIIGITRRKEAVCQWNIIKHEKAHFTEFLHQYCKLNNYDEYSNHHEYSTSITQHDQKAMQDIFDYINERGNPFDTSETHVKNLFTGAQLDSDNADFLLNCIELGEKEYAKFKTNRLEQKTEAIFDVIPKVRKKKSQKKSGSPDDIKKETVAFMKHIDYARLRNYSVAELLRYEICSNSFFLFKDGHLRKSAKSELATEIKKILQEPCPEVVPSSIIASMIVFDFMGYCRKVPVKKLKLKSYSDLVKHLWDLFKQVSKRCSRIDIVFDLYLEQSTKYQERNRRSKIQPVEVKISNINQQMPVDMETFWGSANNKIQLQQIFIEWLTERYEGSTPVYLGGAHKEDITVCIKLCNGNKIIPLSLKCNHEEADDRILFHVNHAVKEDGFERVIIASPDTDVFVNAVHHFSRWMFSDLQELWIISGRTGSKQAVPVHKLVEVMDANVIDILPAVHALTGCDTTSKVGTKHAALCIANKCGYELLYQFGKVPISDEMMKMAERFLVQCLYTGGNISSFDELRDKTFHDRTFKFDIEKLPATTSSIEFHIQRAYFQSLLWYNAPFDDVNINPMEYGYDEDDEGHLLPVLTTQKNIPDDFPLPCNCKKCARQNVCKCRKLGIACCKYCGCSSSEHCSNPGNQNV